MIFSCLSGFRSNPRRLCGATQPISTTERLHQLLIKMVPSWTANDVTHRQLNRTRLDVNATHHSRRRGRWYHTLFLMYHFIMFNDPSSSNSDEIEVEPLGTLGNVLKLMGTLTLPKIEPRGTSKKGMLLLAVASIHGDLAGI